MHRVSVSDFRAKTFHVDPESLFKDKKKLFEEYASSFEMLKNCTEKDSTFQYFRK